MAASAEKVVVYVSGGTMIGVFGGGVLSYLAQIDFYDHIEAMYAASAGVFDSAYFLTRQAAIGSTIYFEEMTNGFISVPHFWGGLWDLVRMRFGNTMALGRVREAVDVDYLMHIIRDTPKRITLDALVQQPIPFFSKVLNLSTRRVEYMEMRNGNALAMLRAAICVTPYTHQTEIVDGETYIDAGNIELIGIRYLLEKYPNKKIVVIFNNPVPRSWYHRAKSFLEGIVVSWMYGNAVGALFSRAEQGVRDDLDIISKHPRILLLHPPIESPTISRTVERTKLEATYRMGIEAGKKIPAFLHG